MTSGKRSAAAPSTGLAVAATLEADDREVALLGAAILDRHEARLLVAELLDDRSTRASSGTSSTCGLNGKPV